MPLFCPLSRIVVTFLYTFLCVLMTFGCIYVLYEFLKSLKPTIKKKQHYCNHILGIIFTFGTIFAILSSVLLVTGNCYFVNEFFINVMDSFCISNLCIQSLLLIIIVFNKLYIVFHNETAFKLRLY
eukprot:UN06006